MEEHLTVLVVGPLLIQGVEASLYSCVSPNLSNLKEWQGTEEKVCTTDDRGSYVNLFMCPAWAKHRIIQVQEIKSLIN